MAIKILFKVKWFLSDLIKRVFLHFFFKTKMKWNNQIERKKIKALLLEHVITNIFFTDLLVIPFVND